MKKNNFRMGLKFSATAFVLFAFCIPLSPLKAQEMQQIKVYNNGKIIYKTVINVTDSITFSKYNVPNNSTGVLINGVVWATCNVNTPGTFVSHPSEAGMFYQWNRNVGWSNTDPMINSNGGTIWDSSYPAGNSWEEDNKVCPPGWRLPTSSEQLILLNSGNFWGELNGVRGRFFGNSDQLLFFPFAGLRDYNDGTLYYAGIFGLYWSGTATINNSEQADFMDFGRGKILPCITPSFRSDGFSVRCVSE